jgi:hypothetical protein
MLRARDVYGLRKRDASVLRPVETYENACEHLESP